MVTPLRSTNYLEKFRLIDTAGIQKRTVVASSEALLDTKGYMTPSSVADSSKSRSEKMHGAMTETSDGNSESANDTSGKAVCHRRVDDRRYDRHNIVWCLKCDRRGYPDMSAEEVHKICPTCRGFCTCKMCLRGDNMIKAKIWDIPAQEKLEHLFHLLSLVLPLVKQIHFEQCSELELERKLFLIKLAKFTFNHLIPPSIRYESPHFLFGELVWEQVPFYLVELIEKTGGHDDKIDILKLSQAKLKLEASTQGGQNAVVDKRVKKIAWFKRQSAAESKLLELNKRKERRGRSTRAIALSSPVDTGDDNVQDDDGEEERQKLEISQAILKECAKTVEDGHRNAAARARYTKPTVPITCAPV
ncbi:hypothetical protein Tco_0672471 [Tanacetum coccineum]